MYKYLNKRAGAGNDDFTKKALEKVESQVNKMSGMITGFLDVARLESGGAYLNKSSFNISELISEVIRRERLYQRRKRY